MAKATIRILHLSIAFAMDNTDNVVQHSSRACAFDELVLSKFASISILSDTTMWCKPSKGYDTVGMGEAVMHPCNAATRANSGRPKACGTMYRPASWSTAQGAQRSQKKRLCISLRRRHGGDVSSLLDVTPPP